MDINIETTGNVMVAYLKGRLDTVNAVQAEKDIQPLKDNADKQLVLDCSALDYISSSGLRLFLSLRKSVEAKGGALVVKHLNDNIRNVFTITGFFKLFDIR